MTLTHSIGMLAATLTTLCFIPQVWLVVKHRKTEGISLAMYIVFGAGVSLWLVYGLLLDSPPIIVANAVTLCLVLVIIAMKIRLG